jgi:NAD(P)-dependent dehydrogenase (short-subunit alcohol dehydrogenase family)
LYPDLTFWQVNRWEMFNEMREFYLITGATSGLGLETATLIAKAKATNVVIAGVRNLDRAARLRAGVPANQLVLLELDVSSLASVKTFAASAAQMIGACKLSGVALNAGVQIVSGDQFSVDGFELTFATNVLGHIALIAFLKPLLLAPAVIVSTASGTHDPAHKLARPYKFFGGYFPAAAKVAAGDVSRSTDAAQLGRDRYATSKLCNIMFTYAMARRYTANGPRFIAFDPGLMPGTELARDQPAALRFAWKNILPTAAKLIDGASTTERSGETLSHLLTGARYAGQTGIYVEFTGSEIRSSQISCSEKDQDELVEWAEAIIQAQTRTEAK